jgi:hypothetical protein
MRKSEKITCPNRNVCVELATLQKILGFIIKPRYFTQFPAAVNFSDFRIPTFRFLIHKPPAQPVRIEKVLPLPGENRSLI